MRRPWRETATFSPAIGPVLVNWYGDDGRGRASKETREGWRLGRDHPDGGLCRLDRTGGADFRHRAVQHSIGLDDPDPAGRRLSVRLQVFLRLQQALLPFFA